MSKKILLFLILFSIIPILSLIHPGLPITHDGKDQVARIANFYANLSQGNIIPRWAGNLNWGYGHPILEFLYPLPSYIASFFHFFGFSFIDSVKIVFGLGMVLSLIFMYMWLSLFLGEFPALFGAILYTYAPYRFIDLYVRGDIGETLAFAFMPLTLYFIYKLYKSGNYRFFVPGGISLALLILAHNAVALMFIPFIVLYGLYLIYFSSKRKSLVFNLLSLTILGFGLSAFFWIPGLLEGKYTLRNIVTAGTYLDSFVNFKELIYGPWSYGGSGEFTVQLGIIQWLSLIVSPFVFYFSKKKKNRIFILSLVVYSLCALFIMLPVSNFFWKRIMLLQNFQFSWRFLTITVFSTAVLGALFLNAVSDKYKKFIFVMFILAILFFSRNYWIANGYLIKQDKFFTSIYNGTTDTGESAPIWSVRFMEKKPKAFLQVINGKANIQVIDRSATSHLYKISALNKTRLAENTLYFPGWEILVDNKPVSIQFQDPRYRGLMTFYVTKGTHLVNVKFEETRLRLISDWISILSIFSVVVFFGIWFTRRQLITL